MNFMKLTDHPHALTKLH